MAIRLKAKAGHGFHEFQRFSILLASLIRVFRSTKLYILVFCTVFPMRAGNSLETWSELRAKTQWLTVGVADGGSVCDRPPRTVQSPASIFAFA
jgi:hypothetical protein